MASTCETRRAQIIAADADGVWLTEAIVDCISYTVREAFTIFITTLYPKISAIVGACVTLAVVIFGTLVASGMIEKSSRDTFVTLFKVACVTYFVQTSTVLWLYDASQGTMDELTGIVWTFGETAGADELCVDTGGGGSAGTIWDSVDCALDVIIGLKGVQDGGAAAGTGDTRTEGGAGIGRGLIAFFMMNMANPGFGFFIGLMGLYIIWSFLMALIKAIHTYLASILAISFMFLLSPLFISVLLFKKTRQYFDKWCRMIGSFILQPVILFAFLSLFMTALDYVLVSGERSLLNAACGTQCAERKMTPNRFLENSNAIESKGLHEEIVPTKSYQYTTNLNAEQQGLVRPLVREGSATTPATTGDKGAIQIGSSYDAVQYEALANALGGGDAEEKAKEIMLATVLVVLTMFVFLSFLNYIPILATDITGGVFEVPNLAAEVGAKLPMGEQMERASQSVSNAVRGQGSSKVGQFTSQLGSTLGLRR